MSRKRLCVRNSDGTVWRPSAPPDYTAGRAFLDTVIGKRSWYFEAVRWEQAPWWKWWSSGRWVDAGVAWEPESPAEFTVCVRCPPPLEDAVTGDAVPCVWGQV